MSEEEKLNSGRVTLAALALFLQSDVLGGKLQSDSGEGLWTHSSVLSSIRIGQNQEYPPGDDYERLLIDSGLQFGRQTETGKAGNNVMPKKSERKAPLWSEENLNDFDTIIFDESQDFSTNEIMTILRTFSIRAGSGERGDRGAPLHVLHLRGSSSND